MFDVYDFDGTIYDGDATIDFYLFCLKKNKKLLKYLFIVFINCILGILKLKRESKIKESFFKFVTKVNNMDQVLEDFWTQHKVKIKSFYKNKKDKSNDIIISATPSFILQPICKELGIKKLIASEIDKTTGNITGKNCRGKEKVIRLYQEFPNATIKNFYSDSYMDRPLMNISKNSYLIKKNNIKNLK